MGVGNGLKPFPTTNDEVLMFYQIIKAGKDEIGLVWGDAGGKPQVEYIYLPNSMAPMKNRIIKDDPEVKIVARKIPGDIDDGIAKLYLGQNEKMDLSILNWSRLSEFSAKVLKQAYRIPFGKVATYSGLAAKVGNPRAARAVGTALANNPFPIIIPCHRVVRTGGSPGQFGGGSEMKRQLLEKEGIIFNVQGMVPLKYIHQ